MELLNPTLLHVILRNTWKRDGDGVKQSLIIVYSVSAILIVVAYFMGGSTLVLLGIGLSIRTALNSFLMILASFIIIGQLNVLLTPEVIEKWLQKFSGIKAVVVSTIAGGLFPGGPYIYYPFIASFKDKSCPFIFLFHLFLANSL